MAKQIRACDGYGRWFEYHPGDDGFDGKIYAEGDADPILRYNVPIRDENELRLVVESYRRGCVVGEKIGRDKQIAQLHAALGIKLSATAPVAREDGDANHD